MQTASLKCKCGVVIGLWRVDDEWWCPKCLIPKVRRQALVDAAKADCQWCESGDAPVKIVNGDQEWWTHAVCGLSFLCECHGTTNLIAQLDAEGETLRSELEKRPDPPIPPERCIPNLHDAKSKGERRCRLRR